MTPEKYRIFDNMIEGVQVIDSQWRYVYVNEAVAQQGKTTRSALLGFTMMEKYPGIEKTEVFRLIESCRSKKISIEWINEFDFPDESKGYFLLRLQPIEEDVLILSFDVTNQKRAEAIIQNTNEYLEEIVKVRTSELVEQKKIIEKQIDHLKLLNKTKDRFFGIVAHDLKSPLYSLQSLSTLISLGLKNNDTNDLLLLNQELTISVENTIKLADQLITWATIQTDDFETALETVSVCQVICGVCDLYKDLAEKKGILLSYQSDPGHYIIANENHASFIIRNLVNNAIKFTNKNGTVTVKSVVQDTDILISVSDTGVGIPDQIKSEIFKGDYKMSVPGTSGEKGTGLGLRLCYEFIRLNNGKIAIESEPGKGTTIRVLFKKQS